MTPFHTEIIYLSLALEALLGLFLLNYMFEKKEFPLRRVFHIVYFTLYISAMIFQDIWSHLHNTDIYFLFLLLHIFFLFSYALIFCRGKFIFKVFLSLIFVSFITLDSSPVMLLRETFHIPIFLGGAFFKISSSLLLLLLTMFMLKFKMDTTLSYPSSYYITMIVTPILNMTVITLLKNYYSVFPYATLTSCFTLLLELLIYFMIWQGAKEYEKNIRLSLIQQQRQYQNQHMEELANIVTDYHQLRHDMKNHFACMDRLLSQEKYTELKEYFYSLSNTLYALDNQIETGNEIANQVINIKYATAHQLNIPMEIQAALPKHLNIPDHLFCAVLSNLLDNAIEASEKIERPSVFVKLHLVNDYLSITVKNRIEHWQRSSALSRKTTKSKPHLHGLGLRIVHDTVLTFNGIESYEIIGDEYIASIMLCLENTAEDT
ncbi:GHKL domain-containing protein [Lachnospiraceae bacterium 45-W7]